jgi:hypothetical protein
MPIRHGGIFASRASTWPRDHFCRSTMAPRPSRPTTWNEFADVDADEGDPVSFCHGVLLVFGAPHKHRLLVGREHGRTIPLADPGLHATHLYALTATC